MFGLFQKKRENIDLDSLKNDLKNSFEAVKEDFNKVGKWISHFDEKHQGHENNISEVNNNLSILKNDLEMLKEEMEEIKNAISFVEPRVYPQPFKQQPTAVYKHTAVEAVQTPVQTAVQTANFKNFPVSERAILWILLNSEQSLSFEDISVLLGKDKSTVRGQINALRQKSEGLIEEQIEKNGKKRLYIPEKMKQNLLKTVKVSVKKGKKA